MATYLTNQRLGVGSPDPEDNALAIERHVAVLKRDPLNLQFWRFLINSLLRREAALAGRRGTFRAADFEAQVEVELQRRGLPPRPPIEAFRALVARILGEGAVPAFLERMYSRADVEAFVQGVEPVEPPPEPAPTPTPTPTAQPPTPTQLLQDLLAGRPAVAGTRIPVSAIPSPIGVVPLPPAAPPGLAWRLVAPAPGEEYFELVPLAGPAPPEAAPPAPSGALGILGPFLPFLGGGAGAAAGAAQLAIVAPDPLGGFPDDIRRRIPDLLGGAGPWEAAAAAGKIVSQGIGDVLERLMAGISNQVGPILADLYDIDAEDLKTAVPKFDGVVKAFTRAATSLFGSAVLGELVHPTKELGLGRLSAVLYDLAGFDPIVRQLHDPYARAAVGAPLTRFWNRVLRPELPRTEDLLTWYTKRLIAEEDVRDVLRMRGLPEWAVTLTVRDAWRELTVRDLVGLAQMGPLDPAWVRTVLRRNRFSDEDVEVMARRIDLGSTSDERGRLRSLAERLYQRGAIDEGQLAAHYRTALVDEDFLPALVQMQRELRDEDADDESQRTYEDLYVNLQIPESRLRTRLAKLGVLPDVAESRITRLRIRRLANEARAAKAGAAPEPVIPSEDA